MSPLGIGVVGAGRFAAFVAEAVADLPDVALVAVADRDPEAAASLAKAHGITAYDDPTALVRADEVQAVLVATPPSSHADLAVLALDAGKHVFCEKPLATTTDGLVAVVEAAQRSAGTLVVDHVLRYNPLLRGLLRLQDRLLGAPQRFLFENDASDEDLDDGHWFWDHAHSGGIFVEHGVHFFDAATMLLGRAPTAVQATAARRSGTGLEDLVSATVRHGDDVLATHTHSFTHAHRCERQLMRLDYGTAEARVEGWIPVLADLDVWTDDDGVTVLEALSTDLLTVDGFGPLPDAAVQVDVERDAGSATARGRGRQRWVPHHVRVRITLGGHEAKAFVYAGSVRAAMADLARSASNGRRPTSGLVEGVGAVTLALAATEAARTGSTLDLSGETT